MKAVLLFISAGCLFSCATRQSTSSAPVVTGDDFFDTSVIAGQQPRSLLDLPQSQDGEIILTEGFYEAEFKSYCLQPGTPDPGNLDAYTQIPLTGYRHEIVENILRNSLQHPELDQKSVQLLLWSTVSGADYQKLSPHVKQTARTLLSQKEIFALQGGVAGVVKNVASYIPEVGNNNWYTSMRQLFDIGSSSYEAYERIAVLREPSVKKSGSFQREKWYRQPDGYYVRYFPKGYQKTQVQVYIPAGLPSAVVSAQKTMLLFDPVKMMAVPTNSNAQRLGLGAPVANIIRQVIIIEKTLPGKKSGKKNTPAKTSPKGIPMD